MLHERLQYIFKTEEKHITNTGHEKPALIIQMWRRLWGTEKYNLVICKELFRISTKKGIIAYCNFYCAFISHFWSSTTETLHTGILYMQKRKSSGFWFLWNHILTWHKCSILETMQGALSTSETQDFSP